MKSKISPLAGVALGALLAAGVGMPALAAPKKPVAASSQAAEIQALKAQLQALTDRLNAQEAAQQQTQAQAAEAQAAAQAVQAAQVQAATQIQTIPAQVDTALAAKLPKPKKSWADDTVVSGRMYYNISAIEQKKDGSRIAPSGVGFDVKRFYLGVDHKFNDVFSGNLTTDFNYVSNDSETQVYVKKAYLQAKISDALVVRLGSADLPWVPFAEDLYGYRFVENTLIDRTKFGTSADWGVHASGKLAGGVVNYAVAVVDGAGYKAPLRSNGMDVEGRISAKFDNLTVGIGGYTGKLGKDTEGAVTHHTANRFDAIAVYGTSKFRIGAEYFNATNWNNVATAISDKANGYSLFGSYNITDKISTFGRYDRVNPNDDTKPSLTDDYFNLGVVYSPTKIVDLALVYKRDQADSGVIGTSNGNIGGVRKGTYDEIGLWGQLRW